MQTKKLSSRSNAKQATQGDFPVNPSLPVTYMYGPVSSTAGQTVINLGFAVDQNNKNNFVLIIDGKEASEGASNDYQFTSVTSGFSSQITMNYALVVNLNIKARYWGVAQSASSSTSISSLQAQILTQSVAQKNYLLNGGFDIWQRGVSATIANTVSTYQADRWYGKNSLGTNGVLTYSQVAGILQGSLYGAKLQITTAPTAAQTNGCELYQTLENLNSIELYNNSACFNAQIKALGNVNQVGLQFMYNTSEAKVSTTIGSEVLVTVNTSSFSIGQIVAQALGTSMTTAGVVGVRIRITGVSSGNTYDLNNGFVVEQASVNAGTSIANFSRAGRNFAEELSMCHRYYEKSYDTGIYAGAISSSGMAAIVSSNSVVDIPIFYIRKRVSPSMTFYSYTSGSSGVIRDQSASSDVTAVFQVAGMSSCAVGTNSGTASHTYLVHWTAEADI